jgi:hypothetical protein
MTEHDKRQDAAHDVLAAEEFGVPGSDPSLHHGPITLPDDPSGISEPHDVLAAEEFAMPAPRYGGGVPDGATRRRGLDRRRLVVVALVVLVALLLRKRSR